MSSSKVVILISTYNGEKYLKDQLDSLRNQTYGNIRIIARDDGSSDATLDILKSYNIEVMPLSKNLGAKGSFGILLEYAIENSDGDYFMFCDQDDIWKKDKAQKTLEKMKEHSHNHSGPTLIHTDLSVVDDKLNILNNSFWDYQNLDPNSKFLCNFIVQNNITGCTAMIDRELAQLSLPIPHEAIMHDWWIGMTASAFGKIIHLDESTILYRQHDSNDVGAKKFDVGFILENVKNILSQKYTDTFTRYVEQSSAFLSRHNHALDNNTIKMLEEFSNIREKNKIEKVRILLSHKLLKQDLVRNIGLFLKV